MTIQFNHVLIFAHNKHESAHFFSSILGLPTPTPAGFFVAIDCANAVTLHFGEPGIEFIGQHYAFLVNDDEFDAILARIQERKITYWADPRRELTNTYNTNDGGRGFYFMDPSGHGLEVITRPYGNDES